MTFNKTNNTINIRKFHHNDFHSVQRIYQQGIDTGNATFQTNVKTWNEWDCSILPCCRLIIEHNNQVAGWAGLSAISSREVYEGVCEVSVYIGSEHQGFGLGKKLLLALIKSSEKNNIWMLQSSIFPENIQSIAIHESLGFRLVGQREKLGKMNGQWRNVILMEKRSSVVG